MSTRPSMHARLLRSSSLAVLLAVLLALLAACGSTGSQTTSGPVEITYRYADFNNGAKGVGPVQDAMNRILAADGVKVKLMPIAGGSYDQKLTLLFSSRQQCDVVWTAPWIGTSTYTHLVQNGDLMALDDLLNNQGKALYNSMTPQTWNAARINGKIYGVINQQIFVKPYGFAVRQDIVQKYNLDLNSIQKWEDLEPIFDKLQAAGINPPSAGSPPFEQEYYGWDPLGGGVSVRADDTGLHAFADIEQPEYKQYLQMVQRWRNKGYLPKDDVSGDTLQAEIRAGKFAFAATGAVIKPGGDQELDAEYGGNWATRSLTKPLLTTAGVTATLNGICANSPHPDAAMKFLNALNTNKTLYNLLSKGIEGKNYVFTDKAKGVIGNPPGVTSSSNTYNPNTDWMFGNQFNAYYFNEGQVGSWEQTKQLNDTAQVSVALGFTLDTSMLQTQLAQTKTISDSYATLNSGRADINATLPTFISKMKQAGLDQIVTEVQKQLNAWQKNK